MNPVIPARLLTELESLIAEYDWDTVTEAMCIIADASPQDESPSRVQPRTSYAIN